MQYILKLAYGPLHHGYIKTPSDVMDFDVEVEIAVNGT